MKHELEQFWISIYELCLTAELAQLSVEIHTTAGDTMLGVPAISGTLDPDWPSRDPTVARPVIEIDDQAIGVDRVVACAIFAPSAAG
jgi:hypothetical protein